jgi:hypothetical protein
MQRMSKTSEHQTVYVARSAAIGAVGRTGSANSMNRWYDKVEIASEGGREAQREIGTERRAEPRVVEHTEGSAYAWTGGLSLDQTWQEVSLSEGTGDGGIVK